jgi:hypothetical protein
MTDINLKTLTPDTSLPTTGFLFGADSQATANPSVYGVTTAITTILGNAASSDALVFNSDTTFSRGAIRNFRFGAADASPALAQTLSVQSVVAGTSNTAGANFTITGSQGTGTGAGGSLIFQVAPAGGSGTAQNALSDALTIASDRSITLAAGTATLKRGSTSNFLIYANSSLEVFQVTGGEIDMVSNCLLSWVNTSNTFTSSVVDLTLRRDAAGVLAQKNGANAQEFRVYENTTGSIYKAILGNRQLMKISGASFTDGAGAQAGTITNAPAVGNPTKWIPIDDNGTTRYIPAW